MNTDVEELNKYRSILNSSLENTKEKEVIYGTVSKEVEGPEGESGELIIQESADNIDNHQELNNRRTVVPLDLSEIEKYAELGFKDRSIAEALGISDAVFAQRKAGTSGYSKTESEAITKAVGKGRTKWRLELFKLLQARLRGDNGGDKVGALLIFTLKQDHGAEFSDQKHETVEHKGNVDHTFKTPAQSAFEKYVAPKLIDKEDAETMKVIKRRGRKPVKGI